MSPTAIVAYLALFATVGFLFVLASLILGRFLRAYTPTVQKLEAYECGEPAVGPGSVQFDLRFYVVALVFLIFEVEVAMFFPLATVFGTATHARTEVQAVAGTATGDDSSEAAAKQTNAQKAAAPKDKIALSPESAKVVALSSMLDLGVFFAVLLVGFAYVWRRGDLDWVRAVRHPPTPAEARAMMTRLRHSDSQS
jgi:NADH-quinone oxidoreductase subunit A